MLVFNNFGDISHAQSDDGFCWTWGCTTKLAKYGHMASEQVVTWTHRQYGGVGVEILATIERAAVRHRRFAGIQLQTAALTHALP